MRSFKEALATMQELAKDKSFPKHRQAAAIARAATEEDDTREDPTMKKATYNEAIARMVDAATDPDEPAEERKKAKAALRRTLGLDDEDREEGEGREERDADAKAQARAIDRAMPLYDSVPAGPLVGSGSLELAREHIRRRAAGRA